MIVLKKEKDRRIDLDRFDVLRSSIHSIITQSEQQKLREAAVPFLANLGTDHTLPVKYDVFPHLPIGDEYDINA